MNMIKKLLGALALMMTCTVAMAAAGGYPLDKAPDRVNDLASLQNGAKLFVNYCLNCHSAASMRYNKLTEIGLTEQQIKESLLFTGTKTGDLMVGSISPADGKKWFGVAPPDLSVIARAKSQGGGITGSDYIYTYLRTFFRDTSRPTGWDNLAFPNAAMPHALWQRQGPREMVSEVIHPAASDAKGGHGAAHAAFEKVTTKYDAMGFATTTTEPLKDYRGHGSSTYTFNALDPAKSAAYDNDVADLTAFLAWVSEPVQLKRKQIGVWVMLFLGLFLVVAMRLNHSFWKHVK